MQNIPETGVDARFHDALILHRQSRLEEARVAYEQVLEYCPQHVQALTFLSVIALQSQRPERALQLTNMALEADPGRVEMYLMRGHAQSQLGRNEAAVASYDRAIVLKPDIADAYFHRGNVLHELGRYETAVASYDEALALKPDSADTWNNLGNSLRRLERYDAAIASYDKASVIMPGFPEPYLNRGLVLHDLKLFGPALASYNQALERDPGHAEAYLSRGNVLKDLMQFEAALASYDRAIAIKPDHAQAYSNRGNLLGTLERYDAALASYDSALAVDSSDVDAHCNRGGLLGEMARYREALESFDRAIAIAPQYAQARFSRSFVSLLLGDWDAGWQDFEWRWKNDHCVTSREKRDFAQPCWLGEHSLSGKTIFLHSEQGLGDTIQFCRYTKLVADRGARVILEIPDALSGLLRSLQGVTHLMVRGEPLPVFDYHCPLLSLPLAFKTTPVSIPAEVPYLHADPARMHYWSEKLGEPCKLRVGLVWSGGFRPDQPELWSVNKRRNIPLAKLAPLKHPDVEFFSLQIGQPARAELRDATAEDWDGPRIMDHTSELHDFAETAALIAQLDLVISVDTSTAHLAGALGKPLWILNRFDSCWRWLLDRTDTPWYPSARIYRQERPGDWEGVVRRVRIDIERLASKGADSGAGALEDFADETG